ncbi:thioredoxin family protein [Variovorax sp. RHLX14]|uniref:thioredoxin family protein n=1 Tax=Variovorax sp. RHLX14 TaxID=1259731 RepID=UPI003F485870
MTNPYTPESQTRADIDALRGLAVLDFGTNWCGHCQAARPLVDQALAGRGDVAHIKVEDGSGRPLGRTYRVKLWPTLVFLRDGVEVSRLVRPTDSATVSEALSAAASG